MTKTGSGGGGSSFSSPIEELELFVGSLRSNLDFLLRLNAQRKSVQIIYSVAGGFAFLSVIWGIIQKKHNRIRYICITAFGMYLLYYILVRAALYANGSFYARYVMPIIPLMLVAMCISIGLICRNVFLLLRKKNIYLARAMAGLFLVIVTFFNYFGWVQLQTGRSASEDMRSTMALLQNKLRPTDDLYIYYGAVPAFLFYAESSGMDYGREYMGDWGNLREGIDPAIHNYKNIHYGERLRNSTVEEMAESIRTSFGGNQPDSFWFLMSNIAGDAPRYMQAMYDLGYGYKIVRWEDARLYQMISHKALEEEKQLLHSDGGRYVINKLENGKKVTRQDGGLEVRVTDTPPRVHFELPVKETAIASRPHTVVIEIAAYYNGEMTLYYQMPGDTRYLSSNAITVKYLKGKSNLIFELPENAVVDFFRINFKHSGIPAGSTDRIVFKSVTMYEDL